MTMRSDSTPRLRMARGLLAACAGFVPLALVAGFFSACGAPPADARIGVNAPDRAQFDPVGTYLTHRCGSSDCHGDPARNFQVFGCEGMRLDPEDIPGCRVAGNKDTTKEEFDATYRSLVGLEPAVMSEVVSHKGEHPELLTLVRKARNEESHKGGALIVPGDAQDVCITSWLASSVDKAACAEALKVP